MDVLCGQMRVVMMRLWQGKAVSKKSSCRRFEMKDVEQGRNYYDQQVSGADPRHVYVYVYVQPTKNHKSHFAGI